MVILTRILGYAPKKIPRKYLRKGFLDSLYLRVKGGTGGTGLPRYGGVGGTGGNVVLVASEHLSLVHVAEQHRTRQVSAGNGYDSESKGLIGKPGEDVNVNVPTGVVVYDSNGLKIGEVNATDSKLVVAKGGIGGCEETGFSGQKGENRSIALDLRLIADIGLVGFPNAGKSTLLTQISNAKPKIAEYPFTTVRPHLGIVEYKDLRRISVADLPGLIEGAHANVGMGHKFLKHLDRTKILLFVVDIQGFRLSALHHFKNCIETVVLLNRELELYQPDLLDRHAMLIVNKMDTPDAEKKFRGIEPFLRDLRLTVRNMPLELRPEKILKFKEILTTSLVSRDQKQIELIKERIRYNLDKYAEEQLAEHEETSSETELFKKLQREFKTHTPTLV